MRLIPCHIYTKSCIGVCTFRKSIYGNVKTVLNSNADAVKRFSNGLNMIPFSDWVFTFIYYRFHLSYKFAKLNIFLFQNFYKIDVSAHSAS